MKDVHHLVCRGRGCLSVGTPPGTRVGGTVTLPQPSRVCRAIEEAGEAQISPPSPRLSHVRLAGGPDYRGSDWPPQTIGVRMRLRVFQDALPRLFGGGWCKGFWEDRGEGGWSRGDISQDALPRLLGGSRCKGFWEDLGEGAEAGEDISQDALPRLFGGGWCKGFWEDRGEGGWSRGDIPGCFAPAAWREQVQGILEDPGGGGWSWEDISQDALPRLLGGGWCKGFWEDRGKGAGAGGYFPGCFAPAAWREQVQGILGGPRERGLELGRIFPRMLCPGCLAGAGAKDSGGPRGGRSRRDISQDALPGCRWRTGVPAAAGAGPAGGAAHRPSPLPPAGRTRPSTSAMICSTCWLRTAYVTNVGRLVGVVSLRELKAAVEGSIKGTFARRRPHDGGQREGDPNGASA
ncbi:unnamed protein product [Lepidochelys kempii]